MAYPSNVCLFRLVDQHIPLIRLRRIATHLRHETGLAPIEVAAALVHFLTGLRYRKRRPLGDNVEVAFDLEEPVKNKKPRLCEGLFHRENADEMIADTEVIAYRLEVGIDSLKVEVLCRLRPPLDAPRIEVEQTAPGGEVVTS